MCKFNAIINNTEDVKLFAQTALTCAGDVTVKKGIYVIDGKSVMGLFSLDLTTGCKVELSNDADLEKFTAFNQDIK